MGLTNKMSNKNIDHDEAVSFLPPAKNIAIFLSVTCLVMILTGFGTGHLLLLPFSGLWVMSLPVMATVIFIPVNFKITRGSFKSVKVLKGCILCVTSLSLLPLLVGYAANKLSFMVTGIVHLLFGVLAFYLITTEKYQRFVRYQYDFFEDYKKAKKAVDEMMGKRK